MLTLQIAQHTADTTTLLAGTGLLDTANEKAAALQVTMRAVASVAGIFFVIKQAVSSGGAIARILIAGLAAGVFVWIVFNVTDLQNRVDNEVTAAGVVPATATAAVAAQPATVPWTLPTPAAAARAT